MAEYRLACHVGGKVLRDQRRQFLGEVGIHPVVLRKRFLRGVDIEASAAAELPIVLFVRHGFAARAGVRADDDQAEFRGHAPVLALVHDVLVCAGQSGQVPDDRAGAFLGLRRYEHRECHVAGASL